MDRIRRLTLSGLIKSLTFFAFLGAEPIFCLAFVQADSI